MPNYSKISEIKNNIVRYLRAELQDESIEPIDVFKYPVGHSYQLTHYGHRNLSKFYEFFEVEFNFECNLKNYAALDNMISGLYYVKPDSRRKTIKLLTTDKRFVMLIKLESWDFDMTVARYERKKGLT